MTEIQFLIDLILNHKLSKEAKDLCTKRIGDVEANLTRAPQRIFTPIQPPNTAQAPSMQAILDKVPDGSIIAAPQGIPPSARMVGGEVNTGGGTRGPRKF